MPSATGSAPPESPDPAPRATNGIPSAAHTRTTPATSVGALRERDRDRHDAASGETVALVGPQLLGPGDQLILAQQRAQLFKRRRVHTRSLTFRSRKRSFRIVECC